jgi:hypothetical protein
MTAKVLDGACNHFKFELLQAIGKKVIPCRHIAPYFAVHDQL